MLVSVIRSNERILARGAAIFLLAGMAAGCSSQVARFNGVDDIFTASTANQRQIIKGESQPYPGDVPPAATVDGANTGSISRGSLEPVSVRQLPAPAPVTAHRDLPPAPVAAKPFNSASADPLPSPVRKPEQVRPAAPRVVALDRNTTGTVEARPAASEPIAQPKGITEEKDPHGWSRAGGTQVTAKQGETVYNLSRRFGVPANVITKVNGLPEGSALQAGQKLIIPTYVYTSKAQVSAPDSNPKVAEARSSTGTKFDVANEKVPLPSKAPQERIAVLPQSPKLKESGKSAPATTAANEAASGKEKAVRVVDMSAHPKAKPEKTEQAAEVESPSIKEQKAPVKAPSIQEIKPASTAAKGSYTVQSGDTLSKIAKKTGVGVAALKSANGMQDGLLKIGQKLTVPAGGSIIAAAKPDADPVKTGSIAPKAKVSQDETVAAYTPPKKNEKVIEQAEAEPGKAPDATGIGRMRWPVRGRVITGYGNGGGKSNDGIDIAVPEGTPVKAAENGVVIYAGDGLKEFGNTVLVRHEDGLVTVYGNASELKVQRGQKVKRGEEIAVSGMSGNAASPKLHFEVRKNSAPVDPSTFLE